MIKKAWSDAEDLLSRLPRVGLLALAVLALRNPMIEGRFSSWGWYIKMPLEFVLLLLLCLTLGAALRVAEGYGEDGPSSAEGKPLA
jgi:hypothetical protein